MAAGARHKLYGARPSAWATTPSTLLASLRDENADIRRRLLEGEVLPGVAAVAIQSLNCDIRAVATTLKAREQEELIERLEALEGALESRRETSRYGA